MLYVNVILFILWLQNLLWTCWQEKIVSRNDPIYKTTPKKRISNHSEFCSLLSSHKSISAESTCIYRICQKSYLKITASITAWKFKNFNILWEPLSYLVSGSENGSLTILCNQMASLSQSRGLITTIIRLFLRI